MHPEVDSDKPGRCPHCGMKLVEKERSEAVPRCEPPGLGQGKASSSPRGPDRWPPPNGCTSAQRRSLPPDAAELTRAVEALPLEAGSDALDALGSGTVQGEASRTSLVELNGQHALIE